MVVEDDGVVTCFCCCSDCARSVTMPTVTFNLLAGNVPPSPQSKESAPMEPTTRRGAAELRTDWYNATIGRLSSNLYQTLASAGLNAPVDEFLDDAGHFVVHMDLPGMDPNEIEAKVSVGKLIVEGRRRRNHEAVRENLVRSEILYGKFRRSLPLPSWVRSGDVEIEYEDGVLELRLKTDPETCPYTAVFKARPVRRSKASGERKEASGSED